MADPLQTGSLDHLLFEKRRFPPSNKIAKNAHLNSIASYQEMYQRSLVDSERFWLEQAETLEWFKRPSYACKYTWDSTSLHINHQWFADGEINVSYNCLDRHLLNNHKNKPAIIWQGEEDSETITLTYGELHTKVCQFANILKQKGVQKGDRVCLYLPMIPELAIAMLACARIGAIHSIVFAGFSAESLSHRINDSSCRLLVTANVGIRGGKFIPLKEIADRALTNCPSIQNMIVVKRTEYDCAMVNGRDVWYHEEMAHASAICPPTHMKATDPLFILYTSGSTGKPKGVVHGQAGYLLHTSLSHKYIFDIHDDDIYWCTADIGWVTGHSYVIYGPLANGTSSLMFEGVPTYPDSGRFWQIIDKYQVTVFYTSPTAIRTLIQAGKEIPQKYKLDTLRILGTVGEPINPEAWMWYYEIIGQANCPIVDTWWQTETGGIMIAPMPGCHTLKPGSALRPFFGVDPVVLNDKGLECSRGEGGCLCIRRPWPGIMLTTWGDHERFCQTYFSQFKNVYFTGDGCYIDEEGDIWLLGRVDDVVNVSGHRIGTAEVESALVSHHGVAEAAVVPITHEIKGQGLHAYVALVNGFEGNDSLKTSLKNHVRTLIGGIAVPENIQFVKMLPKTRSGKIMRRVLRKIANRDLDDLGDISTLANPDIIQHLLKDTENSDV